MFTVNCLPMHQVVLQCSIIFVASGVFKSVWFRSFELTIKCGKILCASELTAQMTSKQDYFTWTKANDCII